MKRFIIGAVAVLLCCATVVPTLGWVFTDQCSAVCDKFNVDPADVFRYYFNGAIYF